jgi:DNA polymerase V
MEAIDKVNKRFGKGTVHVACTGVPEQDASGWRMRQELRTPRYTTKLNEIPIARA